MTELVLGSPASVAVFVTPQYLSLYAGLTINSSFTKNQDLYLFLELKSDYHNPRVCQNC
jgi:hypothetical protein